MADNFAMGNALMTFGQTAGNAINNFFSEQIGAYQHAQETTLKQMQLQAERDDKLAGQAETHRHNVADEGNASARTAQEIENQKAEREQAKANAEETQKYHGEEIGLRGAEVANQEANTASEIGHRKVEEQQGAERIANESGKGKDAGLKAGEELQAKQLKDLQEQLHKNNPDGSTIMTDDQRKTQDSIQKQINSKMAELAHSRAELTKAGKLTAPLGAGDQAEAGTSEDFSAGIAPKASPQKTAAPAAVKTKPSGTGGMPLQPGAKTATNPQTGEKVQLVNGAWIPVNG